MNIFDKFNTLKFKLKINNAIMESVAKAIGEEAEKEIKNRIEAAKIYASQVKISSPDVYSSQPDPIETQDPDVSLLGNQKRDFDEVMNLMEEIKELEEDERFNAAMSAVKNVFEQCLDEDFLSQKYSELGVISDFDKFKGVFFFALYFLFSAALNESKKIIDNDVVFGYTALDLYVMSVYPVFGEWLEQAKAKYQSSDIYSNTNSRQLLKYLYDTLQYDHDLKEENIIEKLLKFRNEIVKKIFSRLENLPEQALLHPSDITKQEQEKKEEEKIAKEEAYSTGCATVMLIAIIFIFVIAIANH